jgi:hypothetical protein
MTENTDNEGKETVWIASSAVRTGAGRRYHTDKECYRFPERESERNKESLDERFVECRVCSGEIEHAGGTSHEERMALKEADPEDIL